MAEFAIVDLSSTKKPKDSASPKGRAAMITGQSASVNLVGKVDTSVVAASLEELRKDLTAHIGESDGAGLQLTELVFKLTLSAEGGLAFVAKGSAEASIEVTFSKNQSSAS